MHVPDFEQGVSIMKMAKMLPILSLGVLCVAFVAPRAKADDWNQKVTFTFDQPVEIPGQVLPAGSYVFKLADSNSDRDVVQVFDQNENHLIGTFLAIPDYRLRPSGKPVISFDERAAGAPMAVRAWFYPGDNYGHEFVYPKTEAARLAQVNNLPVPSIPDKLSSSTTESATNVQSPSVLAMENAPLRVQTPAGDEVTIIEVFPTR
jgi:hypothetical protein